MKFVSISCFVLYFFLAEVVIDAKTDLLVVSPVAGIEDWNLMQRCLSSSHDVPEEEDVEFKNEICRTIAASPIIRDTLHVYPIKENCTEIISNGSLMQIPNNVAGQYSLHEINVNGIITHNFAFSCLCLNYDTNSLIELYISRRLTLTYLQNTPTVPLRLVLKKDGATGTLVANAIAEQPAPVRRQYNYDYDVEEDISGSHCNFSTAAMIRLCTIVLGAKVYRKTITLPSYSDENEPQCVRKVISYEWEERNDGETKTRSFFAWGVECEVTLTPRIGFDKQQKFYIIPEKEPNAFFVAAYDAKFNRTDIVGHSYLI